MIENRPISEIYAQKGEQWAELEAAASLLEDLKSSFLAERIAMQGDVPVNRAESTVKASPDWKRYIETYVNARKAANLAKIELESTRMRYGEYVSREANQRTEAKLS